MSIRSDRYRRWERRARTRSHDGDTPIERLNDDVLVEIISRVLSRQRWRCKRVCRRWLRLARTLPQSLAGFFYTSSNKERFPETALHFFNVSGGQGGRPFIYPSFAFLPSRRRLDLLDCCNGLVLCRWYGVSAPDDDDDGFRYVVCNPATEEWVALPDIDIPNSCKAIKEYRVRLGFDPATSSHFHVFVLSWGGRHRLGVDVYSSETGTWVYNEVRLGGDVNLFHHLKGTVFLNGRLHFHTLDYHVYDDSGRWVGRGVPSIAAVDTDGETWSDFGFPRHLQRDLGMEDDGFIQLSQGRLHYANITQRNTGIKTVVYVLEDYDRREWVLKHTVKLSDMFDSKDYGIGFDWVAIHPECNVIFFTLWSGNQFMCYNMDTGRTSQIRTLEDGRSPYLSYVPFYSELQCLRS
ncbi:F-box protein At5g07610-like [Triticum dicoccoides]|uniref:F-box protein At5g07610-like n=1 Tax=Triticum dicoccoides TaxID=85692 RepID=UPI001890E39B|nr:F-box protein At5g07610-like [Triticum dicoccoides]